MIHWVWILVVGVLCLLAGSVVSLFLFSRKASKNKNSAAKILENAYAEAKTVKKEAILEAKEEIHELKTKCDEEIAERRMEVSRAENRILQHEGWALI